MADIVRGSLSHSDDVLDHPVRLVRGDFNTKISSMCLPPAKTATARFRLPWNSAAIPLGKEIPIDSKSLSF
jgi:hypothetical protein